MIFLFLIVSCKKKEETNKPGENETPVEQSSVDNKTLILLTLQYPPYEYKTEDGNIEGIAVSIIREAFSRMKQPIQIKLYPWPRAIKMIETGKADAIFTAYKNPERETFADYSKEVLMPQIVSLFVAKNSTITYTGDLKKLKAYRFGVVRKVSYGKVFDELVKNKTLPNIDTVKMGEQNMNKLVNGRFDILVSNKYGALDILKKMDKPDAVKELSPPLQSVPSYLAFSKKRNRGDIRDRFDIILKKMKQDGTYDKIKKNYFK
ncbi:MAG: transporter substrate-binding domain-containing protein [bacterium]|nr:transporter substrate-binding domain-containing protein [bacterium]